MSEHASFSFSAMGRLLACPGSWALSKDIVQPENEFMRAGTEAHAEAEQVLKSILGRVEGATSAGSPAVQRYCENVMEYTKDNPATVGNIHVEHKVRLNDDAWGTSDLIIYHDNGDLTVTDYKNGQGVIVSPEENKQMLSYAAAALTGAQAGVQKVHLTIDQPNAPGYRGAKTWTTTVERCLDHAVQVMQMIRVAKGENPPLNVGDQCRFCPGKKVCPKLEAAATGTPEVSDDPAQLAAALVQVPAIKAWCKDIEERALAAAEAGVAIPDHKLVFKRQTRKWISAAAVAAWFRKKRKTALLVPPTPAQAEKAGLDIPGEFITKGTPGYTLVPESDPRPAALAMDAAVTQMHAISLK